ncbi:TPA: D-alanyl-D-alanine carboxypeptidase family protein [Streptococcus suis]
MKRLVVSSLLLLLLVSPTGIHADELMDITRAAGYDVQEINRPKSSIVIDGNTGAVLWADNVDEVRDPASMSKVMTLYMTYEAIAAGKLSEDTIIRATPTDEAIAKIYALSNNKIVAGVDYTVGELITMTAVPSSNATTIMLANYLSNNDPDLFLDMMNAKAQELGMTNTVWYNASGAVAVAFEGHYAPTRYNIYQTNQTTARDLAILTYNFVKNHPAFLEHTNDAVVTVKQGTPYEETFETYNYSLPGAKYGIEGVDGLKTGSSPSAGFNYIATIKRGEQRHIAVIMGVGDWADQNGEYYRHPFGNALIEKSYKDYEYKKILTAGSHNINGKGYEIPSDVYATVAKGTQPSLTVENSQLHIDTGLATVSDKMVATIPVQESSFATTVSNALAGKTQESSNQTLVQKLLSNWYWFLLVPFILLVLLFIRREIRRNRYRKEQLARRSQSRRRYKQ